MICPNCNTEYTDGFYTCADCSVPLIEKSPEIYDANTAKPQVKYYIGDFAEVFQTSDQSDFLTIKLAFDGENIPHSFSGDILVGYCPGKLARFFVPTEFEASARELLKNLQLTAEHGTRLGL